MDPVKKIVFGPGRFVGGSYILPTMKKRIDYFDQYASSCLLAVHWTIPPYEVFRFAFPSISAYVLFHFSLSSLYCNILILSNMLLFCVLMHISFCLTTYYVKLYFMEVMFSSLCCKFIIEYLLVIVNIFFQNI